MFESKHSSYDSLNFVPDHSTWYTAWYMSVVDIYWYQIFPYFQKFNKIEKQVSHQVGFYRFYLRSLSVCPKRPLAKFSVLKSNFSNKTELAKMFDFYCFFSIAFVSFLSRLIIGIGYLWCFQGKFWTHFMQTRSWQCCCRRCWRGSRVTRCTPWVLQVDFEK